MDYYEIWCDIKETRKDLEFCDHLHAYLGALRSEGLLEDYKIRRRKLGFGPAELGEFNISIHTKNLAQLDDCFQRVAAWEPAMTRLHAAVFSMVTNARFGLLRDFPDPVRMTSR